VVRPVGSLRTRREAPAILAREKNECKRGAEGRGGQTDDSLHGSG